GHVINDPELVRAILLRPESFTKNGPGGSGALLSQVLGEYAILNMEGEAHRALRARLTDLFMPAYLEQVLPELLDAPLADLRDALEAGETVDLVRFAKALSGRITCRMLDIDVEPETEAQVYLRISDLGDGLISPGGLFRRRLSARQVARSRRYLEQLAVYARRAYARPNPSPASIIGRLQALGLGTAAIESLAAMLFLVGMKTVSTALPRIVALLVDSGQLGRLRAEPALLPAAIDEGLRCTAP